MGFPRNRVTYADRKSGVNVVRLCVLFDLVSPYPAAKPLPMISTTGLSGLHRTQLE